MYPRTDYLRMSWATVVFGLVLGLAACKSLDPNAHLVAFTTQMMGMNEVPPAKTYAGGKLDAVLDKNTRLLRWKLSYSGLSGPATAGHFHGPAAIGVNGGVALPLVHPLRSPMEGSATLSPAQAADLLAGKWYINLHTAAHPAGEIRGQMILVP